MKYLRNTFGAFEIVTGIIGLWSWGIVLAASSLLSYVSHVEYIPRVLFVAGTPILFCVLAIAGGTGLLLNKSWGRLMSLWITFIQVPIVTLAGVEYQLSLSKASFAVSFDGVQNIGIGFSALLGPTLKLSLGAEGFAIGVNLLAIVVLILLLKMRVPEIPS